MTTSASKALYQQAQNYIPGGVNSPVRAFGAVGGTPRFIKKAKGAYLIDADDNTLIDYVGSWGPMILGHADADVLQAVHTAVDSGLSFGAPCELEIILAQMIVDVIEPVEKVRMVNSGTEATMTALRLARGITKRDKIIKFNGCYHGHSDMLLVKAGSGALTFNCPSSPGVPEGAVKDTLIAEFNDIDSVKALFEANTNDIAAIIIEPIAGNMNLVKPQNDFLQKLRELCDHYGALLIIDEVMTGFRVALGGACALYNITPDLVCYGKVIGGGMPVGAIAGPARHMDQLAPNGNIYQAGTLSGNPVAMSAGIATLKKIQQPGFYQNLSEKTQMLCQGLSTAANAAGVDFCTDAVGGMFGLYFSKHIPSSFNDVMQSDKDAFNRFFHAMLEQNIYLAPSAFEAGFVSIAHDETILNTTIEAAKAAFLK